MFPLQFLEINSAFLGSQVDRLTDAKLHYTPHDRRYVRAIEDAYAEAGRALVALLIDDYAFISRLQSLKHYFLIDRGDWLVHFMESAEAELTNVVAGMWISWTLGIGEGKV